MKIKLFVASSLFALISVPLPSAADQFHYVNLMVGDRAAGMGGAYTAVSDDATGLYYNPAGVVYAGKADLSGSMNAYHSRTTTYQGVLAGKDWERKSSVLAPGFFGVVQPVGSVVVGLSYAVPDAAQADQDQEFQNFVLDGAAIPRYRINYNETDTTYNFGPSLAFSLNDSVSVGLTLYGHYRSWHQILNILSESSETWPEDGKNKVLTSTTYSEIDEYGVRPILGVMVGLGKKTAFGAALSKTYVLNASGRYQKTKKVRIEEEQEFTVDDNPSYPLSLALGWAYFPNERFLVSADYVYNWACEDIQFNRQRQKEATWNVALGTEWFITRNWGLRTGLFTDRANTSDLEASGKNQNPHIDLLGGSISISRHSRASSLTFGMVFSSGSGESQILPDSEPQDASISSSTYYMSASYRY